MLYIVATPIGNLGEITYRAVEVLQSVDIIAAEDTRRTLTLLNKYGIKKTLISYRKFNERECTDGIVSLLEEGKSVALVSDAGMPLISDPGSILVRTLIEKELEYTVISGACAAINGLVLSGMDTGAFLMLGFLPEKKSDKDKLIDRYKDVPCTMIFYSAPHDITKHLQYLYERLGCRPVAVVREISKIHEQTVRGQLGDLPEFCQKGEFVIVVGGKPACTDFDALTISQHYGKCIEEGLGHKDAMKKVASERKIAKSTVYKELLTKNDGGDII